MAHEHKWRLDYEYSSKEGLEMWMWCENEPEGGEEICHDRPLTIKEFEQRYSAVEELSAEMAKINADANKVVAGMTGLYFSKALKAYAARLEESDELSDLQSSR